jgi:hypothetical protein
MQRETLPVRTTRVHVVVGRKAGQQVPH